MPRLRFGLNDHAEPQPLELARKAQAGWAAVPIAQRMEVFKRFREISATEPGDYLAASEILDHRRSHAETLTGEVIPLLDACRFLEKNAARILAPRIHGVWSSPVWLMGVDSRVERRPLGVVLIIGPSNFPLFLPGVQVLQALAAGNAVLLKPGLESAPVARVMHTMLVRAGLPLNVLTILSEDPESGRAAIREGVDKVFLTGSSKTGASVLSELAANMTPGVLELSDSGPVIVKSDADLNLLAKSLIFGLTLNSGATCIAPRRVYMPRTLMPQLQERLIASPQIRQRVKVPSGVVYQVVELIHDAIGRGARLIAPVGAQEQSSSFLPTILADVPFNAPILNEDVFAPVMSLVPVANDSEAVELVNRSSFGLSCAVFGSDRPSREIASRLNVGSVVINDLIAPTADARLPFTARRGSGFGSTRGVEGLLEMTTPCVISSHAPSFPHNHLEPPSAADAEMFRAYLNASHSPNMITKCVSWVRFFRMAASRRRSGDRQ